MHTWRGLTLTAVAMLAVSCGGTPDAMPGTSAKPVAKTGRLVGAADTSAADDLWTPAKATLQPDAARPVAIKNGRSIYIDGTAAVYFHADIEREALTTQLMAYVEKRGWRQRSTEFLNPGRATSFASGWRHQCACLLRSNPDGRPRPSDGIFKWHGEWANDRDDQLGYDFFTDGGIAVGAGWYLPANVAGEISRTPSR